MEGKISDNQISQRKTGSPSPVAKQIIWIGGIALLLTLGITFLIVRPHYVKIQKEITGQKDQIRRNMKKLESRNAQTIGTLEKKNKELQETVANLQTTEQKYKYRIHKLNQEMETLHVQIQSLENAQKDLKTTQANLETEKSKLETELSKLEREKTDLDDELRQLRISSGQMTMKEKTRLMNFGDEKSDYIAGSQIILHYAKGEEEKAKQIRNQLTDLGGKVQLKPHKASKVEKHNNTIYYYKGNYGVHAANQIKASLSDIEPLQVVESKVWWFWVDMNKLNLWL
jgi:chromosome segregation ATPase